MLSAGSDGSGTPTIEPTAGAGTEFATAHAGLRLALIQAIARRTGKSMEPISLQEAYSDIPLAELYHRKIHINRFAEVVERFLFRWWRPQ